jgi:hypothetical protein
MRRSCTRKGLVFLYGLRKYQHADIAVYNDSRTWVVCADQVRDSEPIRQRAGPDEPQIGDVGFVSQEDGAFCRLFNAWMPRDHPWNAGIVPDNFIPINLNEDHVRHIERNLQKGAYLYASHTDRRMDAQGGLCVT